MLGQSRHIMTSTSAETARERERERVREKERERERGGEGGGGGGGQQSIKMLVLILSTAQCEIHSPCMSALNIHQTLRHCLLACFYMRPGF